MLVIKVELWSAITGRVTEIARMHISNDGANLSKDRGNYVANTIRGRNIDRGTVLAALTDIGRRRTAIRSAWIINYPRTRKHVWNLVADALRGMKYGTKSPAEPIPRKEP